MSSNKAPHMNCRQACVPICNDGTPVCDAQNKQACDLKQQQAQQCEDSAYDKVSEHFADMGQSWTPIFVIGSLFILYGIIS